MFKSKVLFIFLIAVCLCLTQCMILRDKYGGNAQLRKEYRTQLIARYGESVVDAKVWVGEVGDYLLVNFKEKGFPVRMLGEQYSVVTDENAVAIAQTFLKQNEDVFGIVGCEFAPEPDHVQIVVRDTVNHHRVCYLTQIYNGVPVNPEDSGEVRYMEANSGNVDIIFSDSTILSIRSGAVRNINHDTAQTLSMNAAWDLLKQTYGETAQDTVVRSSSIFWHASLPKSTRLIILSYPSYSNSTLFVWEIPFEGAGAPTYYVDAHTGKVVMFRVE